MPVRQISPSRSSGHELLVDELLAEWQQPQAARAEPVILEEQGSDHRLAHVYVVWSKWSETDRVERSEIIMEAAEKKLGEEALNITIAMGLTPHEADQFRLDWR